MCNLELSYSEYSILVQALLNRIDFLREMVKRTSSPDVADLKEMFQEELSSVRALCVKLKNQ